MRTGIVDQSTVVAVSNVEFTYQQDGGLLRYHQLTEVSKFRVWLGESEEWQEVKYNDTGELEYVG